MKSLAFILSYLTNRQSRRNLQVLGRLLGVFVLLVTLYSVTFHVLMVWEGQPEHSWLTGVYWTLVVMSTLGFGDITFESDVGRVFSVVVLVSGTLFMLVLLPFTFIQFFYVPWMEAQAAARAPRELPAETRGHVILTRLDVVGAALIRLLERANVPYVLVVAELASALQLHDQGYRTVIGELDDPETYQKLRVDQAALVATTLSDTANTNVAFTVRETCPSVPIVATASSQASVDILELAGCSRVLQLGEMLGQSLARRVLGRDAKSHVIGEFGELLIAEAAAGSTPLVGRMLKDIRLRDHANVNVVGVWDRGRFRIAAADTLVESTTVLVLAASRDQLDVYDELFCIYKSSEDPVVIIGGGRVGRATGAALEQQGIDYRIVERLPERIRKPDKYVLGDAAALEVLQEAGIERSASVVITTHDDDMNVYLTIYCRRLRPDIQILVRANLDRNVSTLHRAGADFILSYASTGANAIYNLLQRTDTLLLAEGLSVFRMPIPKPLAGRTLTQAGIRQKTGCNVVAVIAGEKMEINPDAETPLPENGELVVIGDADSENRFLSEFSVE
jgi:voltage-gated potassium channel